MPQPLEHVALVCPCYTLDNESNECRCYSFNDDKCSQSVMDGWHCIHSEFINFIFDHESSLFVYLHNINMSTNVILKYFDVANGIIYAQLSEYSTFKVNTIYKVALVDFSSLLVNMSIYELIVNNATYYTHSTCTVN